MKRKSIYFAFPTVRSFIRAAGDMFPLSASTWCLLRNDTDIVTLRNNSWLNKTKVENATISQPIVAWWFTCGDPQRSQEKRAKFNPQKCLITAQPQEKMPRKSIAKAQGVFCCFGRTCNKSFFTTFCNKQTYFNW